MIAVSCGTPTPATMRVVQIEPGPTPQRTAETCALISASAPSAVATFPPTISIAGNAACSSEIARSTASAWPCELSTRSTSAPARISASARSIASLVTPTAAPTRSRPSASLFEFGWSVCFSMSLIVISPRRLPRSSTTSSFSIRFSCSSSLACSMVTPSRTVISPSLVITVDTAASRLRTKRRSRLVTMPTSFSPRTTGRPEMWCSCMMSSASWIGWSGSSVIGSTIMPDSKRFTFATSAACASIERFLWMKPSPPSCAMVMAVRCSVTVSIGEDTRGIFSLMPGVSWAPRSTSVGCTDEGPGSKRTSSNVSPSRIAGSRIGSRIAVPRAGDGRAL